MRPCSGLEVREGEAWVWQEGGLLLTGREARGVEEADRAYEEV